MTTSSHPGGGASGTATGGLDHRHDHHHGHDHDHDHHHDDEDEQGWVGTRRFAQYPDTFVGVSLSRAPDRDSGAAVCRMSAANVPDGLEAGDMVDVSTIDDRHVPALLEVGGDDERVQLNRALRMSLGVTLADRVLVQPLTPVPVRSITLNVAGDIARVLSADGETVLRSMLQAGGAPLGAATTLVADLGDGAGDLVFTVDGIEGGPGPLAPDGRVRIVHGADAQFTSVSRRARFSDVGGLHRETGQVRELIELPVRFPFLFRQLGVNPIRGVLFHGPPGTGKTHVARAVAGQLAAKFFYINAADVAGKMGTDAEDALRRIFHEAAHSAPAILFIDEIDALAPKREDSGLHRDTKLVSQLLTLMDGLRHRNGTIVIGTTNRVDAIDPALRRPGRFEREILFRLPDASDRLEILDVHTREMPLTDEAIECLEAVAARTQGFTGADLMSLARAAALSALQRVKDPEVPGTLQVTAHDFEHALADTEPSALREVGRHARRVQASSVGGFGAVRAQLKELMSIPLTSPERAKDLGLSTSVGIVLHGPSGSGKSLLVQSLATELDMHMVVVRGAELFSKWLGESESSLRYAFAVARQVAPCILLLEQLDAIAKPRDAVASSLSPERVLQQLIVELDALERENGLIVVGTVEQLADIDPSVLRSGRLTYRVEVPLPDENARREILAIHLRTRDEALRGVPASHGVEIHPSVIDGTSGWSGADLRALTDRAKRLALRRVGPSEVPAVTSDDLLEALAATRRFTTTGPKED